MFVKILLDRLELFIFQNDLGVAYDPIREKNSLSQVEHGLFVLRIQSS